MEDSDLLDRFDRLETAIGNALKQRDTPKAEKAVRRLEDEFSDDELEQLRDTREYGRFRRMMDRYADELEQEAVKAGADNDDPEDGADDEVDEGDDEREQDRPAAKAKRKPAAKPRGGRHAPPPVEDELPGEQKKEGPFAWLLKD